jgi:hypothetical protein
MRRRLLQLLLALAVAISAPAALAVRTSTAHARQQDPQTVTVYITRTGEKYHRGSCRYLRQSKIAVTLAEARKGYAPCSVCRPPR